MNKTILIGNIVNDLELRKTSTNKSVIEFRIAINEGYGDKKTTEYINVVAWENLADRLQNYCGKGSKIMIEGKIKTDSYEKNGQKIYKTYVKADNVEFMSSRDTHSNPSETQKSVQSPLIRDDGKDVFGRNTAINAVKNDEPPVQNIQISNDELPFY